MNRIALFVIVACVIAVAPVVIYGEGKAIEPAKKIMLFNGKSFDGLFRHIRGEGNVDETWKVKPDGVLACSGKPAGYIRTEEAYKNYKVHFEYRWASRPGNNGILVHMVGEDQVWPRSLECQGGFQNQGDYFEIGGFEFNEHKAGGHRVRGRRVFKYGEHNEKEPGQWNTYEVWCVGGTVRPYVNGKLMNEATDCAITAGKICLQSEGVPIEYRNFYIEPVKDKPWPVSPKKKTKLFNGKDLDGWVRFSPEDKPDADKKWTVDKVWSVRDGVIRCEGKPNGFLKTTESYANYKLHLEWRWTDNPTNSGVLLHSGGIDQVWPKCIEAQLKSNSAGDFVLINGTGITVGGKDMQDVNRQFVAVKKQRESNEKPAGKWNSYDIICDGKTVTIYVNGLLQNKGTNADPCYGPICLQSEGGPIEFRNIYIEPASKR